MYHCIRIILHVKSHAIRRTILPTCNRRCNCCVGCSKKILHKNITHTNDTSFEWNWPGINICYYRRKFLSSIILGFHWKRIRSYSRTGVLSWFWDSLRRLFSRTAHIPLTIRETWGNPRLEICRWNKRITRWKNLQREIFSGKKENEYHFNLQATVHSLSIPLILNFQPTFTIWF